MKRIATLLLLVVAMSFVASGQIVQKYKWVWKGARIDSAFWKDKSIHGLAVTPDGNIWVQGYYNTDSVFDAVKNAKVACRSIKVYTPAGVQTAFSPITVITTPAKVDTLYSAGVGMTTDYDGNIIVGFASRIFKLNGTTGAGMLRYQRPDSQTVTTPGVTSANEIILSTVFPGKAVQIINGSDFSLIGNAIDSSKGYSRSINVSADGKDIYQYSYADKTFFRYHSATGTLGTYAIADTLLRGMAIESSCWNPKDGYLYVSSGGQIKSDSMWQNRTWYAFDPVTKTVKDSIVWTGASSTFDNVRPRAIAFSPGGDTAYVGAFSVVGVPGLCVFVREQVTVGVDRITDNLPDGFKLEQNFPNPFNPSTEIRFSVPEAAMTSVVVYDMLGREVQTLVNEYLNPGDYRTTFTADGLSSGTYLYVMTSGTHRVTKKMVFMK